MPLNVRLPTLMAAILLGEVLPFARYASAQMANPVRVSRIIVSGNTVLSQADIDKALDAVLVHHPDLYLDGDTIEELRRAVTVAYIDLGYIASGAVVTEPPSPEGILTIHVIEGYLVGIDVSVVRHDASNDQDQDVPNRPGLRRYVCDRLALPPGGMLGGDVALGAEVHPRRVRVSLCNRTTTLAERPLNMNALQVRISELLQDPIIGRLNVEVGPGGAPGEAQIDAKVVEKPWWNVYASLANDQAPDVGAMHGEIGGTVRDVVDPGDALTLSYGRTAGANIGSVRFETPVTPYDTRIGLYGAYNGAGVVSAAFSGLGITSVNRSAGLSVSQPLLYGTSSIDGTQTVRTQTLTGFLSWDYTISDQSLLGQPFSFSPGYVNGHAEAAAVHAGLEWSHHTAEQNTEVQVISLRATVSHGLNMLGATNLPNADFSSLLGQAQYAVAWGEWRLFGRAAVQLSSQSLYSFEQVAIGGPTTVRGYVQNALIRDSALIGSVELRKAVGRLAIPHWDDNDGEIDLGVFLDGGEGWDHGGPEQGTRGISSVGLGLQWDLHAGLAAQVYYGYGLVRPHDTANFLQPVSFGVSLAF